MPDMPVSTSGSTMPRIEVQTTSFGDPCKAYLVDMRRFMFPPTERQAEVILVCHPDRERLVRDVVAMAQERAGTFPGLDWLMAQIEVRP